MKVLLCLLYFLLYCILSYCTYYLCIIRFLKTRMNKNPILKRRMFNYKNTIPTGSE